MNNYPENSNVPDDTPDLESSYDRPIADAAEKTAIFQKTIKNTLNILVAEGRYTAEEALGKLERALLIENGLPGTAREIEELADNHARIGSGTGEQLTIEEMTTRFHENFAKGLIGSASNGELSAEVGVDSPVGETVVAFEGLITMYGKRFNDTSLSQEDHERSRDTLRYINAAIVYIKDMQPRLAMGESIEDIVAQDEILHRVTSDETGLENSTTRSRRRKLLLSRIALHMNQNGGKLPRDIGSLDPGY